MVLFIYGCTRTRGLAAQQSALLQGYDACVICRSSPVAVVEAKTMCHWCFVPLFVTRLQYTVVCPTCRQQSGLPDHIAAAKSQVPSLSQTFGVPVARMVMVPMDRSAKSSTDPDHISAQSSASSHSHLIGIPVARMVAVQMDRNAESSNDSEKSVVPSNETDSGTSITSVSDEKEDLLS
jgi:hypothetical protein